MFLINALRSLPWSAVLYFVLHTILYFLYSFSWPFENSHVADVKVVKMSWIAAAG